LTGDASFLARGFGMTEDKDGPLRGWRPIDEIEGELLDVAEFFGIDGPHRYDGRWRAQITGTNTAIRRFEDRDECVAYIAYWRERFGEPHWRLTPTSRPSEDGVRGKRLGRVVGIDDNGDPLVAVTRHLPKPPK